MSSHTLLACLYLYWYHIVQAIMTEDCDTPLWWLDVQCFMRLTGGHRLLVSALNLLCTHELRNMKCGHMILAARDFLSKGCDSMHRWR